MNEKKYLEKIIRLFTAKFTFGVKKPVSPTDTGIIHNICGIPVHIYYYTSKNTLSWTPGAKHIIYSKSYEGPHHPMCKIDLPRYKDYIINEGGVKWKGTTVVFSTEELENNNPEIYNDDMLAALVLACFYSLHQRLHYYIHRIEDLGQTIDYGHNMAPVYTFTKINEILPLFTNEKIKNCVENTIHTFKPINLAQLKILFEEIKYYSDDLLPKRKEYILKMYHALLSNEPFNEPRIKLNHHEPVLKPRILFR